MTLRTHLVIAAMLGVCTAGPALAAGVAGTGNVTVRVAVANGASAGRATQVSCTATDPAGIRDFVIEAVAPNGTVAAVRVADKVVLSAGTVQAEGAWVPLAAGLNQLRCTALGATSSGSAILGVVVAASLRPMASVVASVPVALVGKQLELTAEGVDPEGGPVTFAWTASGGSIVGSGKNATWTAPANEGNFTVEVAVTDDTGLTTRAAAAVRASVAVFRDSASVQLRGPRRVTATADGSFFVADTDRKLHKLTRRGEFMATALEGVRSVAFGGQHVFAGTESGELVTLDPETARVVGRIQLGIVPGPIGLAYDSARELLWMGYASGSVEARKLDGTVQRQIHSSSAGPLRRLVDVAVDSTAGIVWVAQDRSAAGGMIFGYRAVDGVQVKTIGADGSGPATFLGALGVSAAGQLYASDSFTGEVDVLDSAGAPVRTIGSASELARPAGMAFMADGSVLVANMDAGRLDRFGGETPLPSCAGDSDCDGMLDADELAAALDPNSAADALLDPDADGLLNLEELRAGSNILLADSDGDGFLDGAEVAAGFDPLNGTDHLATLTASGPSGGPGLVQLTGSIGGLPVEVPCETTWSQVAGPEVTLKDAGTLAPSFVARKAGTYRFALAGACDGIPAVGAVAAVVIENVAPLADAGRTVVAPVNARLQLSAAATSDANGDTIRLGWEQVSGEAVTGPVTGRTLTARFAAAGTYGFSMTATDANGLASSADANVVVVGSMPVPAISLASPVVATASQIVTLDASGSFAAPDAAFSWLQVEGQPVALSGQGTARATFQPTAAGRYAFRVVIQQGQLRSPPALVEVFVAPVAGALPVAAASAPPVVSVNQVVTLDGSASTGSGSLAYSWRQVSGPAAGLRHADASSADAYFFEPGAYEFELAVADGAAVGVPARVRVEARAGGKPVPVALASAQAEAVVGERVVLDGTASVGAKSFRWTQVAGPWTVVQGGASAAFVAPAVGRYGFELEVEDGQVRSAPVRIDVVVTQNGMEN